MLYVKCLSHVIKFIQVSYCLKVFIQNYCSLRNFKFIEKEFIKALLFKVTIYKCFIEPS